MDVEEGGEEEEEKRRGEEGEDCRTGGVEFEIFLEIGVAEVALQERENG